MRFSRGLCAVSLFVLSVGCSSGGRSNVRFVTIGTGGVTGVYYPTGGAICKRVSDHREAHGIQCNVESTGGSVYNVKNVASGELDFGIAQSDVQWKAARGEAPFTTPLGDIRAMFSLHPETAVLVVRRDAGIEGPADLTGKRINLGNPGSGQEATARVILDALGLPAEGLALAGSLRSSEQGDALRDNRIDGFLYTVGHPNGGLKDILYSVDATILALDGAPFERLVGAHPYYIVAETPGGMYNGVVEPVPTIAVKATMITSARVPDEVVYHVTKAVFDDLDAFKALHPAYRDLTPERMLEGLSAPLHPGAQRYYQERGWSVPTLP